MLPQATSDSEGALMIVARQVLVVHNHYGISNQMLVELTAKGISVLTARTIAEAERELTESTIDAVIIAENVEKTGDGFALALRAKGKFMIEAEDIVLIATTAKGFSRATAEGFVARNNHRSAVRQVAKVAA